MAMLPFLFLTCFFSFITLYSSASQISYKHHCASIVPDSNPHKYIPKIFPLGQSQAAYYIGGDRILGVKPSWQHNPFLFRTRPLGETDIAGLFKVEGFISIKSTYPYYNDGDLNYGDESFNSLSLNVAIRLHGFWSESTGKLCMVGSGMVYSKGGKSKTLPLDAVFKLNNVFNSSSITSLVSGSLESLNSQNNESYFEPFYVLMLPQLNYEYTLDSEEAKDKFVPIGNDDKEKGLSEKNVSLCSFDVLGGITKFHLEYSSDCSSLQNCTPFSGISGYFPPFMYLNVFECTPTKKHHLRVLLKFNDHRYRNRINLAVNPRTMLVGEGRWDEKKNHLCVVACHFLGLESSSLSSVHVGDCSVRLRFTFPSVRSIKDTNIIVGKIWSNKTVTESGYFKDISFRKEEEDDEEDQKVGLKGFKYDDDDDQKVGLKGFKYEYTQLERVNNLCPRQKTVNKGKKYPTDNMNIDMSVRDSNGRLVGWSNSSPLFVGDKLYNLEYTISPSSSPSSLLVKIESEDVFNNCGLFNISYKISITPDSTLRDSNSLFNMSYDEAVKISAEGVYDAGSGSLCMIGCRNLPSSTIGIPMAHSVDCEILVKYQFPELSSQERRIEGSIESTRKKSDPLYFKSLYLTSATSYKISTEETMLIEDEAENGEQVEIPHI